MPPLHHHVSSHTLCPHCTTWSPQHQLSGYHSVDKTCIQCKLLSYLCSWQKIRYHKAADLGVDAANYVLAVHALETGDDEEARKRYTKAAQGGLDAGQYGLAYMWVALNRRAFVWALLPTVIFKQDRRQLPA